MRVILFRHGPAVERDAKRWPDDRLRPLTPRGEQRTRRAARGVLRLEDDVRRIFTSPLVRCTETAGVLAHAAGLEGVEPLDALGPRGSWRTVINRLTEESPELTVALVGHAPELGKLAGVLLFGAPALLPLRKAGGCSIEFDAAPAAGQGRLRWFLPPRALARVGATRSRA